MSPVPEPQKDLPQDSVKPVLSGTPPEDSGALHEGVVSRISEIPVSAPPQPAPLPPEHKTEPPVSLASSGALPAGLLKKLQEKKIQKSPEGVPPPAPAPRDPVSEVAEASRGAPSAEAVQSPLPQQGNSPVLSGSVPAPEPAVSSVMQNGDMDFELSGAEEEMSYEQRARMERFRNRSGSEEANPKRIDIRELLRNHHSNL
jgi:hypothetical protein